MNLNKSKVMQEYEDLFVIIESNKIHFPAGSYNDFKEAFDSYHWTLSAFVIAHAVFFEAVTRMNEIVEHAGLSEGVQMNILPSQQDALNRLIGSIKTLSGYYKKDSENGDKKV